MRRTGGRVRCVCSGRGGGCDLCFRKSRVGIWLSSNPLLSHLYNLYTYTTYTKLSLYKPSPVWYTVTMKTRNPHPRLRLNGTHHQNRKRYFVNSLWTRYRMTASEFISMYHSQRGQCAICQGRIRLVRQTSDRASLMSLRVDHCHRTGKVRGFLCHGCNIRVGAEEKCRYGVAHQDCRKYLNANE